MQTRLPFTRSYRSYLSALSRSLRSAAIGAAVLCGAGSLGFAQLSSQPVIPLATAQRMSAAARAFALTQNTAVAVAVVDAGGDPIVLERMDGVALAAIGAAQNTARTAARTLLSTKLLEDIVNQQDRSSLLSLGPDLTFLQGGLPVLAGGAVIGGVGCSGGSSSQLNEDACRAALAALNP